MRVQSNLIDTAIKAYHNGVLARDGEEAVTQAPTLTPAQVDAEVEWSFLEDLIANGDAYPEAVPA